MIDDRIRLVAFGDESIRKAFLALKSGKFEEKALLRIYKMR